MTKTKLTEFGLDAPTLPKELRHAFNLSTRFVTSNVERNFPPLLNDQGVWKILVEIVPAIRNEGPINLLGVMAVQVVGDAEGHLKKKRGLREIAAIEWIMRGAGKVFQEFHWQQAPLEAAVQRVVDGNFLNVAPWKRDVKNPLKSASVDILIEMDDEQARIVASFKTLDGTDIRKIALVTCPPSEFLFVPCLGKLRWIDAETVQLTSRKGDKSWTASLSD